jgi:hypothetical protein
VAAVAARHRGDFDACLAASAADAGPTPEGGAPTLLLTLDPSGEVRFPTLDDVELARSELGACLKDAARKMSFPPFQGKAVRVEVPLAPPEPR